MRNFVLKLLTSKNIQTELEKIGFDKTYCDIASKKYEFRTIKIFDLTPAQANILKQTAISVGADCATHREVITGQIEKSNVVLGGSISEIKKIAEKLKYQPFSLNILAETLLKELEVQTRKTKIVGILNITPNSFSDGGKYFNSKDAIEHFYQLIDDGAEMIDIGAESTKPFSEEVPADIQIERLSPVLKEITNTNIPISIDTRSSKVADYVLDRGIKIINDVSGLDFDSKMIDTISKYKAGVIIQHSLGTPKTMQTSPEYNDVVEEIYLNLLNKINLAKSKGIENIIIDPGIGFGKTKENNFEILDRIEEFYSLHLPVMVGISRKSLLEIKEENNELKDSLSLALSYPLIKSGVDYLRVHNVKLHKQLLSLAY